MKDILSEIIAYKRIEVEQQKQIVSLEQLQEQAYTLLHNNATLKEGNKKRSMKQSLATSSSGIIAEFKRRSPSKGWIKQEAQPEIIVPAYQAAGASVLSILTDEHFFGGNLRDIRTARPLVDIPILRKDFIIDEYQLLQASIVGADAVLLIAACLTEKECLELTQKAHELNLEVLLEIHNQSELSYINNGIDMIGVNNRHLGTFKTDIENSFKIAEDLKRTIKETQFEIDPLLVSESGISDHHTILRLRSVGFRGFLMGESFMSSPKPDITLEKLISDILL